MSEPAITHPEGSGKPLGYRDLLARAEAAITTIAPQDAPALHAAGEEVCKDSDRPGRKRKKAASAI